MDPGFVFDTGQNELHPCRLFKLVVLAGHEEVPGGRLIAHYLDRVRVEPISTVRREPNVLNRLDLLCPGGVLASMYQGRIGGHIQNRQRDRLGSEALERPGVNDGTGESHEQLTGEGEPGRATRHT